MSPRVAIVINKLDFGGTESVVRRLASGAASRGRCPQIFTVRGPGAAAEALRARGVPVTTLDVDEGLRRDPLGAGRAALRLGRLLQAVRADVVHSFLFEANAVTRFAARRARLRLIASFRSTAFRLPVERLLEQTTGRWVNRYTAVSHAVATDAAQHLSVDPARVVTIHNGIEICCPPPPPRALHTLGFLGRLHPEKGLDVLLRALAALGADAPTLRVAGAGSSRSASEQLAAQLGIADRIRFLGQIEDSRAFLDSVDALVVPSLAEGFSNAALEAMARARPVIASDIAGNAELVSAGETGLLVPPGQPAALSAAIQTLGSSAQLGAMGRAGLERVQARFTEARMVERHLELWDEVARLPLPPTWAG